MRKLILVSATILVIVSYIVGTLNIVSSNKQIELKKVQLHNVSDELMKLESQHSKTKKAYEENSAKIKQLEKEKKNLETKLQAKIEAKRKIAQAATLAQTANAAQRPVVTPSGSCGEWLQQAGVTDKANAYTLIMRESGCNVNAVNKSSGACGIPQALPCSKLGGTMDPVAQIMWMQNYVFSRYGSWANAVAHSNSTGWY